MKNLVFGHLKSAKFYNRYFELKFASKAALSVFNTKRTISGLRDKL